MKLILMVALFVAFSCRTSFTAENITINTENGDFFKNLVSDTYLLLDPVLQKIIADDFDHVVKSSRFQLQVNSWKPRPNPKNKITTIYNRFNNQNVKESLASLIQPVVEIACSPQQNDPLNEISSKCINELLKYRIIETIQIGYVFKSNTSIEQNITRLSNLNDRYRYHQIVWAIADILNGAYEKVSKKIITKNVNFTKYPLPIVAISVSSGSGRSYGNTGASTDSCRKPSPPTTRINSISRNPGTGATITSYKTDNAEQYNIDMKEYEHCLDIEKLKAGGNLADINQRRAQQAKQKQQQAHQAQEAENHRVNHGAINPFTGEFLSPAGDGYVGTRDGTYYTPAGPNGIINTRTGDFSPLTR